MPAFEVRVTVNIGDPPTRFVVIAANEHTALKLAFKSRVAFDTDHEITLQKIAGSNYELHPNGTLLIGFDTASSDSDTKDMDRLTKKPTAYRKLDRVNKRGMSPRVPVSGPRMKKPRK